MDELFALTPNCTYRLDGEYTKEQLLFTMSICKFRGYSIELGNLGINDATLKNDPEVQALRNKPLDKKTIKAWEKFLRDDYIPKGTSPHLSQTTVAQRELKFSPYAERKQQDMSRSLKRK